MDTISRKIKLLQVGMQLDLGGIAKGYVAGEVIRMLQANNIQSSLADAGGDIVCSAAPPGKKGWQVAINLPGEKNKFMDKQLLISHAAIATSGDLYQFMEHEGKRYGHIIDPRTGYGITFSRNVTVVAADGAAADWLATACSILTIRESKKLAKKNNAALLITQDKKGRLKQYRNRLMKFYLREIP